MLNGFPDAGPLHFNGDFGTVLHDRFVHLGEGGRSNGFRIEHLEYVFRRVVQFFFNNHFYFLIGEWGHTALQFCQFSGDFLPDQVGTQAQHLSKFYE